MFSGFWQSQLYAHYGDIELHEVEKRLFLHKTISRSIQIAHHSLDIINFM